MHISELLKQFSLTTVAPLTDDFEIRGVSTLALASEGELSFLSNPKYREQVTTTKASAVLVKEALDDCPCVQILCKDPYIMLAHVLQALYPEPKAASGIHPSAFVHESARVADSASVGPNCTVDEDAELGEGVELVAGVTVGKGARIGNGTKLFPGVVLYPGVTIGSGVRIHANCVIGSDGFGYAQEGGRHLKVPQIGSVIVEDGVEIGAGTCIDRGALDNTVIGAGTIIDNQVQVAHGVKVGKASILVSQTGISGSSEIGNGVVLAGKVGVVGHVKIGDGIWVLGDSVVTKNLDKPGRYAGNPAIPHIQYQKQLAHLRRLPELKKQIAQLQKSVDGLLAQQEQDQEEG